MKRRRVRKLLFSGIHQDIQGLLVDIQWQLLNNPVRFGLDHLRDDFPSRAETESSVLLQKCSQGLYNDDWWIALADAIKSLPHIQIVRVRTLKGYDHDSDKQLCSYLVGSKDSKKQVSRWISSGTIDYPQN